MLKQKCCEIVGICDYFSRNEVSHAVLFPLTLFQIATSINEGKPVLEEIIFRLLSKRLEEGYCNGESGFILEGIPRTRTQAVSLSSLGLAFISSSFSMMP